MALQEALRKMIAPSQGRPSIWRKGVLQIWVTRACDKACFGCTQGSNLAGKPGMMSVEQYAEALASLEGYFGVVGMFGGNPAIHPQFDELCQTLRGSWVPIPQRGIWCNHPKGKAWIMRSTFYAQHSNLNVHLDREAFDQFVNDWPECRDEVKGLNPDWPEARNRASHIVGDARHSPVYVAMQDVIPEEEERWKLIENCDINKYWSAMICVVNGKLRGFFCEIAGAMAMLHQNDPSWPDLGVEIKPGWWKEGMEAYADQVKFYCHRCGIPMRGYGSLAIGGEREQVSKTHADIYQPKHRDRPVELVQLREQLHEQALGKATDYIQNGGV